MPRPPSPYPRSRLEISLPQSEREHLDTYLGHPNWRSGAYSQFFLTRLREFFTHETLDLATLIPGTPSGIFLLRGRPEALELLKGAIRK